MQATQYRYGTDGELFADPMPGWLSRRGQGGCWQIEGTVKLLDYSAKPESCAPPALGHGIEDPALYEEIAAELPRP